MDQWSVVEFRLRILSSLVRSPVGRSRYTLLMRPNKIEIDVHWFRMSCAVFVGFSCHGKSIYNKIHLLKICICKLFVLRIHTWSYIIYKVLLILVTWNKSWRQHPTRHQLYGHLPPITKTIQVRRTRHAGHCWRSKDELISDVLLWTPHMDVQKQDDQHELTYSNYVRTQDVTLKTCRRRWMIGRSGERGSGISVLAARHDDDDDDLKPYNRIETNGYYWIEINTWNYVSGINY